MMPPDQPGSRGSAARSGDSRSALDWAVRTDAAADVLRELDLRARRRRRRWQAAGGAAAVALLMVGLVWQVRRGDPGSVVTTQSPHMPAPKSAIVSMPERRTLSDGSIVELDSDSQIAVSFSEAVRRVTLTRGKAHFQVTKNAARPFVVSAGVVAVRAVGTAFAVELGSRAVEVLVTEGRVAVTKSAEQTNPAEANPDSAAPMAPAFVDAGKRAVVNLSPDAGETSAARVRAVSAAELDEQLSWRVPRLDFSGTPLAEAIPLFNQYSRVQLVLGDPALNRLQLSGILRADNTEALLKLLKTEFGVTAERSNDHELVLRKAQ